MPFKGDLDEETEIIACCGTSPREHDLLAQQGREPRERAKMM